MADERNASFTKNLMAGKVCFMAGATSGINRQIARRFCLEGAIVYVISRSLDKVTATVDELSSLGTEAAGKNVDVRSYPDVEEAVGDCIAKFGKIDMVLAGQAGNFPAGAAQMSSNAFKSVIDIDLLGTFNVCRATVEHLNKTDGNIIAITAPQGSSPWMYQSHVCAAKAGVNMLIKCLALEWGPSGIRVNAISPGPIDDTEGMRRLAGSTEQLKKTKDSLALRDLGAKDDIADAALWLCSSAARYVTGTIIEVEGGTSLGDASGALKL